MEVANLEDAYRLSPVQLGRLETAGHAVLGLALSGPLHPQVLRQAWEQVIAAQPVLRTSFRWEGLREPFQLVQRRVAVPWETRDWRGREEEVPGFLAAELARPLHRTRAPLLRLLLLQTGPDEHVLVWTHHRLLLDRESALRIAGQVLDSYEALVRGESWEPEPARPFRDYVDWARRQDPAAAPSERMADVHQITAETLVQGAWALLLCRLTGRQEALFGIPVGRPAPLPGAETMIGPLLHTVPLRVPVDPEAPLDVWLRRLQERQAAVRQQAHVPPAGAPQVRSQVLMESVPALLERQASVNVREVRWMEPPDPPLTLTVRTGDEFALAMTWDPSCCAEAEILFYEEGLRALLDRFAADPLRRVGALLSSIAEPPALELPMEIPRGVGGAGGSGGSGGSEIVPVPRDQPLPATFYQEWGLRLEGIEANSLPSALSIEGPIDLAALRRALTGIAARHESLRTSFRWENGEARLVIAPPAEVPLPGIDLTDLPEDRRTAELQRLIDEEGNHVFDLARGPLFTAKLARLGGRQHALLLNVHHVISDGWSVQILQRELFLLYKGLPLPPLPIQAADFAHWQRRVFAGAALAGQLAWWRRNLAGLPPPPALPNDRPRPAAIGMRAVRSDAVLQAEPARALRAFAHASNCSLSMVLLAAIDALLHSFSGEEDLIVSTIFAARNRPELAGLIGLFMNTVPVRVRLSGNPSFRSLVERVRDAMVESYAHQDVPFPRVLSELFPGHTVTRTMLTGVVFNLLSFSKVGGAPLAGLAGRDGDLVLRLLSGGEEITKNDLVFTCQETDDAVWIFVQGAADLFSPARIAEVARRYVAVLVLAAADPDIRLDQFRLDRLRASIQSQ